MSTTATVPGPVIAATPGVDLLWEEKGGVRHWVNRRPWKKEEALGVLRRGQWNLDGDVEGRERKGALRDAENVKKTSR